MKIKVDYRELKNFKKKLEKVKENLPNKLEEIAVAEGVKFVKEAQRIVDRERIYASRNYKRSFHSDDTAKVEGNKITVGVGNLANYASFVEKGFRSHFVPGYWQGNVFVYDRNAKGGMYVGPYKGVFPGRWVVKRALNTVSLTQNARISRKLKSFIAQTLNGQGL